MTDPTAPEEEVVARPGWKRDMTVFLGGQTVSMFGSMLVQYAIVWHLTLVTQSGWVLTAGILFGMVPQAVVSIFGGVFADRVNRRFLIILSDGSIAVTTLILAVFMLSGYQELWLIFLTLTIRSMGAGFQQPAVAAVIPQLAPPDQLMRVNGIFQTIQSAIMLVAPAAAAAIYASMSIVAIFFVDVVTAVIGIGLLLLVTVPTIRTAADSKGYLHDLREGLRYAFSHARIRWVLAVLALVMILGAAPSYLTPLLIVRSFDGEVWLLTLNELAFSIGMLLAGLLVAAIGDRIKRKALIIVAFTVVFGIANLGLGLAPNVWVFYAFMFVCGATVPFLSTPSTVILQERVEPEFLGRVFGLVGVVMSLAMPLGMVILGPLADVVSVESLIITCGVLTFVSIAIAAIIPSGREALADPR